MWFRVVVYVMFVASCAKGGAEIRVATAGMDIDTIELYIGVGEPKTTYLIPESKHVYPQVTAWSRDPFNEVDKRTVVAGELTVFQFVDAPDQQLGVVIAVGVKNGVAVAATSIRSVSVPRHKIARYDLTLRPLDTYSLVLDRWGAEPTACVVLTDRTKSTFDAVLPPTDADCDGATPECADTYWNGWAPPTLERVECLTFASSGACALAGPQCFDGKGWQTGCTMPSVYCVASSTCGYCSTAEAFDCARDLQPMVGAEFPPHFQCSIKYLSDGTICQEPIPSSPYVQTWLLKCDVQEGVQISRAESAWGDSISYSNGATIAAKELDENCNFFFHPSGRRTATDIRMGGMVAAKFTNGRGIAVPVVFNLVPAASCGSPTPCTPPSFDPNDAAFTNCLTTPYVPL